jgi:VanZ family protein
LNNAPPQDSQSGKLPAFVWWATTIAWTITIFQLSTSTYGVSLTGWLLSEFFRITGIQVSQESFHTIHFFLRKLAHLTEYGIYALLLYGSFGAGRDFRWSWRRAVICTLIAAGYSLTDELHQWFVPGRGGSIHDSALDASGALLAMAGLYVFSLVSRSRASSSAASVANPAET